jgi:hypothetical protein
MKTAHFACLVGSIAIGSACLAIVAKMPSVSPPNHAVMPPVDTEPTNSIVSSPAESSLPRDDGLRPDDALPREQQAALEPAPKEQTRVEDDNSTPEDEQSEPAAGKRDFSYLAYYVYSELPPDPKPADIVLESLKAISIGTPLEEIKLASDAFGLDFIFMKTVARIESGFDPKARTGSYIGLFQLSNYEFAKYGSGDITNPRDNSVAAGYKFLSEATLFERDIRRKPTFNDLYLIHQQGWQGAAEHTSHPERIAWKSMCETDEGREKGVKWCKRAVWGNTLPDIKRAWKSVDKLTSGVFATMWRHRVDTLYARYSAAAAAEPKP